MTVFVRSFLLLGLTPWLQAEPISCPPHVSHIAMTGTFSSQPGVSFDLRHFVATLVPEGNKAPACFQKITVVSHAEIFVSNASLTQVFSEKLSHSESKIKNFKIENGEGKVILSGSINKIIPVEFSIAGPITTDGTALLLDARQIKADGIPVKALLTMLGEHLSSVLGMTGMNGVQINGNQMSFFPEQIAHLKGYISSVETTSTGVILRYGKKPAKASVHP